MRETLGFLPSTPSNEESVLVRGHPFITFAKFSGFWTPSPPCSHFGLTHKTKFTQPRLLRSLLGTLPLPLSANIINGLPLTLLLGSFCHLVLHLFLRRRLWWRVQPGPDVCGAERPPRRREEAHRRGRGRQRRGRPRKHGEKRQSRNLFFEITYILTV